MERLSRSDLEAVLDFAGEVVASAREPERQGERLVAGIARMADVDVNLVLYGRIDATYHAHDVTLLGDQPRPSSDDFVDAARSDENPYLAHAARQSAVLPGHAPPRPRRSVRHSGGQGCTS